MMKGRLKKDICNLGKYAFLSEVEDLAIHRATHIGDALWYACRFWTGHLMRVPSNSSEVQKEIDGFFTNYFLFWIEVLSLMGDLDIGVHALNDIQQWYILVSGMEDQHRKPMFMLIQAGSPCKWVNDSQCFLLEYFDIIHDSPPHIYHSALPFSPSSSWLHEYYAPELLQEVRVVRGLPADWGTCSRTVSFNNSILSLAHWESIIAVGLESSDIISVNAITGSQTAVLSGHTGWVRSLAFSLDGVSLLSGSDDKTVKLWDIQTGGIIKNFYGHTGQVHSVSISPNYTIFASGSQDNTIRLWYIQTGECFCVIDGHSDRINSVSFSPTNPQLLMSGSNDYTVRQWNVDGCYIRPTYRGCAVAFSLDGTLFVSWGGAHATVQNSDSRTVVAELQASGYTFECCCFSPNSKLVAGGAMYSIYIWDITGSDPHLVKYFVGHTDEITSFTFSSSLISASRDRTVRFWQISTSPMDPVTTDTMSTLPTPAPIRSVSLQTRDSLAISSDFDGVVKIWDIITGLCRASFKTPVKPNSWRDAQLIEGRLIFVWWEREKVYIWDLEKGELLQKLDASGDDDLRISGDGSKLFCLNQGVIEAWSLWTGEVMGRAEAVKKVVVWDEDEDEMGIWPGDEVQTGIIIQRLDPLHMDNSRIWVCFEDGPAQGWDFGISGSSPIQLSNTFPDRPHLEFIDGTPLGPSKIIDTITRKEIFQLPRRYSQHLMVRWDCQYLVAGYGTGEVLILDFHHALPQ